jgi:hypothetical protein
LSKSYADDIAVHLGSLADIKIYHLLLRQYALATGGVTNFYKKGYFAEDGATSTQLGLK